MISEGGVEDGVGSFEEVRVQKKLVKEGKIEVVENLRFMTEARRKELERGKQMQMLKEESTSTPMVKKETRKFSLIPHPHHRRHESRRRLPLASIFQNIDGSF